MRRACRAGDPDPGPAGGRHPGRAGNRRVSVPRTRTASRCWRAIRAVDPTASRVAAVRWGEFDAARPLFDAVALGQIDHWVMRPVQTPDEDFHHAITGFLSEWASRRGSGFEAIWVIGERWSARSQELRDTFSRNGIPIGFYDAATQQGQRMIRELGLVSPDLPVVVLRFGADRSTLVNPDQPGDRRRVRPDDTDPGRGRIRRGRGRRRPGRAGRRRLRVIGRPAHRRGGRRSHRRPGRDQLDDPQLPRFLPGGQRVQAGLGGLAAGVAVRHHVRVHAAGREPVGRRRPLPDGAVRRQFAGHPHPGHRDRRQLPAAQRAQPGGPAGQRRVLRRGGQRGAGHDRAAACS